MGAPSKSIIQMKKFNITKLHRTISLIISIPVILWAASGVMHPLMTTLKPAIATQVLEESPLDTSLVKLDLQEVLQQNSITSFSNFRMATIGGQVFYQMIFRDSLHPRYFSAVSGKELANGDELYARELAKFYLHGSNNPSVGKSDSLTETADVAKDQITEIAAEEDEVEDCCMLAANGAMQCKEGGHISSIKFVEGFDEDYRYVNRLLPVYQIKFERKDGLNIYVQTTTGKFAYAVDSQRATFDKIFAFLHTYSWLDAASNFRIIVMMVLCILAFITTILGLYIFFSTKKAFGKSSISKSRRWHRYTALVVSLFTLMFSFSGAYHAFKKFTPENRDFEILPSNFETAAVNFSMDSLFNKFKDKQIVNLSLADLRTKKYLTINMLKKSPPAASQEMGDKKGDNMKSGFKSKNSSVYANLADLEIDSTGEVSYAKTLATAVSGLDEKLITEVKPIHKFEGEYGFVNKRLPVYKIQFGTDDHVRYYIETATGILSTQVRDADVWEGLSFSMLHKHHFLDFAGKEVRDISTMFWAAAQILMVVLGLILWLRIRKKQVTS